MEKSPLEGFKKVNLTLDEVNDRVVSWSPSLNKLNEADQTLETYFKPVSTWGNSSAFALQSRAIEMIHDRVDRLYGKDTADKLREQVSQHPISESGTHISFPRDRDSNTIITYDNDLVLQGAVLSASLYRNAGLPFHFGWYSSRVPVKNTNSAEYAQFTPGDHLVRTLPSKKADNIIMFADKIGPEKIQDIRGDYQNHFFQKRIGRAKGLLSDATSLSPTRLKSWQDFLGKEMVYSQRNESTIMKIEEDFIADEIYLRDYTPDINYANELLDTIQNPLAREGEFGFADQVMAVQTKQMNRILPDDIKQVTIDYTDISMRLMAESLRDKNSFWHKIFADPTARDEFVYNLADIRTGWTKNKETGVMESPFLPVSASKRKPYKVAYEENKDTYTPENLADMLESGKIMPTCALEVAFMLVETGILPHGGMFQTIYAPDIQVKFSSFLEDHGELDRAKALRSMPLNIATQSPCFGLMKDEQAGDRLLRFSDLIKKPLTKEEASIIPNISTKTSLGIALPTLHNFFTFYEPHITGNPMEVVSNHGATNIYNSFLNDQALVTRKPKLPYGKRGPALENNV